MLIVIYILLDGYVHMLTCRVFQGAGYNPVILYCCLAEGVRASDSGDPHPDSHPTYSALTLPTQAIPLDWLF
jgi:hypothetical protein